MVFQVIHLAAFLFTKILTKNLKAGAPSRILDINSEGHRFGGLNINDLDWSKRPFIDMRSYGAAKTAQLLAAWEFADQLKGSGVNHQRHASRRGPHQHRHEQWIPLSVL